MRNTYFKISVFITMLVVSGAVAAAEFGLLALDFVAPSVPNKSSVEQQTGLILYDNTDGGFFGVDAAGTWVQLSVPSSNAYAESKSSTATNWPFTSSTWGDLNSISLAAGEWDISAQVDVFNNGALSGDTTINLGISTTSGNSSAGLNFGENRAGMNHVSANQSRGTVTISAYKVEPTTTTTYYLKANAGTVTNLQHTGYRIFARRIR